MKYGIEGTFTVLLIGLLITFLVLTILYHCDIL